MAKAHAGVPTLPELGRTLRELLFGPLSLCA